MKENWQNIQLAILGIALIATTTILIKGLFFPSDSTQTNEEKIDFPKRVALDNWQFLNSDSVADTENAQNWQYKQKNKQLQINTYYIYSSEGNVNRFLQIYQDIPPATLDFNIRYKDNLGFYAFFIYEDQPQIASCINPYGETTVTSQQFAQNVSQNGLQLQRILPWLFGQQDLINRSCLFTVITLNSHDIVEDEQLTLDHYADLEQAWFSWYESVKKFYPVN